MYSNLQPEQTQKHFCFYPNSIFTIRHGRHNIFILIILLVISLSAHAQMSFVGKGGTVSPDHAKSTSSQYTFSFNAYNTIQTTIDIKFDFPSEYTLQTVTDCTVQIDSIFIDEIGCVFQVSENYIAFTDITLTQSTSAIVVGFITATANYQGSTTIQINFYDVGNNSSSNNSQSISQIFELIQIVSANLECSLKSSSKVVGEEGLTFTVEYIPSVQIEKGSIIQLEFQTWGPYVKSNFVSRGATDSQADNQTVCEGKCSIRLVSGSKLQVVTYNSMYSSSGSSASTAQSLTLLSARNPSSTYPKTLIITIYGSSKKKYMTGSTTFNPSTASTFNAAPTFSYPDTSISAVNTGITLIIRPKNPISSNTRLRLIYSPELYLSYTYLNYSPSGTEPSEVVPSPTSQLLLSNLLSSSASSTTSVMILSSFTLTNPPFAQKPTTLTFRTEQFVDLQYYAIDESVLNIVATVSTITQAGVFPVNSNIGATTTYNIWFVTINRLITDSYIVIDFPKQIILSQNSETDSTCSLSGSSGACAPAPNSTSSITITASSSIQSSTNLSISITSVANPLTTTPTDSFAIRTYYYPSNGDGQDSIVDQLTNGLSLTANSVPLQMASVESSSYQVNAKAEYVFSVKTSQPLPAMSVVTVEFPSEDFTQNVVEIVRLGSAQVDDTGVTGCTISQSAYILELNSQCISQPLLPTSTLTITLSNIQNPRSFKPTSPFTIQTFTNFNLMQYASTASTLSLAMNVTTQTTLFQVQPQSLTANQQTTYTFEFKFLLEHFSGDRILVGFPKNQVTLSSAFTCTCVSPQSISVSCSKYNSSTLEFKLSTQQSIPPASNIKLSLTNFTNNWLASSSIFTVKTATNDSTLYYQQHGTATVQYQPAALTASINNDNKIIVLGTSKIKISMSSPYSLEKATDVGLLYIVVKVPTYLTPVATSDGTICTVSYASSSCSVSESSPQIFNITNVNPNFNSNSPLNLMLQAQTDNLQSDSSQATFDIQLYYDSIPVLSNQALTLQAYCQSPCKQCMSGNPSKCLSCLPQEYTQLIIYFSADNTCVAECPQKYYETESQTTPGMMVCLACNSSACDNCQSTANQCTSCIESKHLYDKTCVAVCPQGFYILQDVPGSDCLQCIQPCSTCTSTAKKCLSCVQGYFLDIGGSNQNKCVSSCSNSNYLGMDALTPTPQCKKCTNDCLTCEVALNNCTSCDSTNYQLLGNACVRNCPAGSYSNVIGSCVDCEEPCLTCSSKTQCQSCVETYYLFEGTGTASTSSSTSTPICTKNCPDGYLPLVNKCQPCTLPCYTCSKILTNCTSCPKDLFLYQFQCLTKCPETLYPYNKICTKCIDPCVTCANTPEVCLSCIAPLKLLNNTCVEECPQNGYVQQISQATECIACPSKCIACESAVKCTLCESDYYIYLGACTKKCPVDYPVISPSRQCQQCNKQCLTCDTSPNNCTQCPISLFKYKYTCMQSCPFSYYSNPQTYQCEDALTSRILFFPVLIIAFIIAVFASIVRYVRPPTSLPTTLVGLLSLAQLGIWIFMTIELAFPPAYRQRDIDYTLPLIMCAVCLISVLVTNIAFFWLLYANLQSDDYVRGWAVSNSRYMVLQVHRYGGLILHFKFFRFVYSRFFNLKSLSLPFKRHENIFPLTTVFTVITLVICEIPMIVGSFSLLYSKLYKDQMFYTSVECLLITLAVAVLSLVDTLKSDDYFQETDYIKERKYLEKVKDMSFNQLQDDLVGAGMNGENSIIEGEHYHSKVGGKCEFSRQDPQSLKQLYFQEQQQVNSNAGNMNSIESTQAGGEGEKKKQSKNSNKAFSKINIFNDTIQQLQKEDEQLYEEIKHPNREIQTEADIDRQNIQTVALDKLHSKDNSQVEQKQDYERKLQRAKKLGLKSSQISQFNDNRSVLEGRDLKRRWNNIIQDRQNLARKYFSNNGLEQIDDEPQDDLDEQEDENGYGSQYGGERGNRTQQGLQFQSSELINSKIGKVKRRKKKGTTWAGNKQLERIYLQRQDKGLNNNNKKSKAKFMSSKIQYDF